MDTEVFELFFSFEPVGEFSAAADVGEVGEDELLVERACDYVGAEVFGVVVEVVDDFVF